MSTQFVVTLVFVYTLGLFFVLAQVWFFISGDQPSERLDLLDDEDDEDEED